MKCPKCESDSINECRLDVVVYTWYGEDNGEEALDSLITDESLLSLSAYCRECDYRGTPSEFTLDRKDLINPIQEDKEGKYVQYLIEEGKVIMYPGDELLRDLQKQLGGLK